MFYQLEHIGMGDSLKKETGINFNYPLHLHQNFELIFLHDGEMKVSVNECSYLLHSGQAVLIFPNQMHSISSKNSRHTLFIFSPHIIQAFFADKSGKLPKKHVFSLPQELAASLCDLSSQSSKYEMKGILYTVCALFDKQTEYYNVAFTKENTLLQVLFYIEKHFKSTCTVYVVAKNAGLNPDYLSRLFKQKTGISCNHYITARRLSYAAFLLTNTDASCLSCALDSGFSSLRSFNRNFKRFFGVSPINYKTKDNKDS